MSSPAVNVNPRLAALVAGRRAAPGSTCCAARSSSSGELQRMIDEESLRGATSNPAIFEKAILGSDDYDEQLERARPRGRRRPRDLPRDGRPRRAGRVRRLPPGLGRDRPRSTATSRSRSSPTSRTTPRARSTAARYYWERVDRPNLMIKIPGTPEGVPAIEEAIYEGINVNVTLLFAVEAYREIAEAYIRGHGAPQGRGQALDVHSVASLLRQPRRHRGRQAPGRSSAARTCKGLAGLANARAAYQRFLDDLRAARWRRSARRCSARCGRRPASRTRATPTRSTSTGSSRPTRSTRCRSRRCIAVGDHGEIDGETAATIDPTRGPRDARARPASTWRTSPTTLLVEGVAKFVTPMVKLMAGIESKREAIVTHRPRDVRREPARRRSSRPSRERIEQARDEDVARRVWHKDPTLWGGDASTPELADRLGWLTVAEHMQDEVDDLQAFASEVHGAGLTHDAAARHGRLEPRARGVPPRASARDERFRCTCSTRPTRRRCREAEQARRPRPDAVRRLDEVGRDDRDAHATSSTSGSARAATASSSSRSPTRARRSRSSRAERGFRRVFRADPEIGGRYSALQPLRPRPGGAHGRRRRGAARRRAGRRRGLPPRRRRRRTTAGCGSARRSASSRCAGRDKLTFVVDDPEIASVGLWLEQLVAESTGKHGKGILPVADEPVGAPEVYGDDRVFVHLRGEDAEARRRSCRALAHAGQRGDHDPDARAPTDLGRIFFFAEFATAVARLGAGDQPVRPAQRPGGQGQHEARARASGARRTIPTAPRRGVRARRRRARRSYVAILGLRRRRARRSTRRVAELRARDPRRRRRRRRRSATARATCTRPASSTRAARRTGVFVQLVDADGRAGDDDVRRRPLKPRRRAGRPT